MHKWRSWEQHFFRLAATVLACRLEATQGSSNPIFTLLGELDYGAEMHLVLREAFPDCLRKGRAA